MQDGTTLIREVEVKYRGRGRAIAPITDPDSALAFVRKTIAGESRENFMAIYFDARNQPIAFQVVSIGTASASLVHPREVFQPAILVGAVSVLLAHNHPSGNPEPSREDLEVTRRLFAAGMLLGVRLLDHLVIGFRGFTSIKDKNPQYFEVAQ